MAGVGYIPILQKSCSKVRSASLGIISGNNTRSVYKNIVAIASIPHIIEL